MTRKKAAAPAKVDTRAEPGPRNAAAIGAATAEFKQRPVRAYVRWVKQDDGGMRAEAPYSDDQGHAMHLADGFGTTSSTFVASQLTALEWATRSRGEKQGGSAGELNAALAIVQAIDPADELEAALAVQMASCHFLACEMLGRAAQADDVERIERYGNMATKLSRTFTTQIEALARMRGKGQQTVRVEHVTVQPGGQAIVGDVHHPRGAGAILKPEDQPYGTGQSTLWNRTICGGRRVVEPGPAEQRSANHRRCRTGAVGYTAACLPARQEVIRTRLNTAGGVAKWRSCAVP